MPKDITDLQDLKPGTIYEDSYSHPCFCVAVEDSEVKGISLVDGSYPRIEDLRHAKLRILSAEEAWHWRVEGPADKELEIVGRWWQRDKPQHLINPATGLENLFFFALYQVQWDMKAQQELGAPIKHEWHDVESVIEERNGEGRANLSFKVSGSSKQATVKVKAFKADNDWPIEELSVEIDGQQLALIKSGKSLSE